MSELQNKAVTLAMQSEGDLLSQSPADRSVPFLESALHLYFALGGDSERAMALASARRPAAARKPDAAIADVMIEVAVASHLADLDMVQATYNRLDVELAAPRRKK